MSYRLSLFDSELNIIANKYDIDKYNLVKLLIDYHKLPVNNYIDYDDLLHKILTQKTNEFIKDLQE